jgi:phage I-like protein
MKRAALAVVAALLLWGCPNPETGKVDPYLTARTIILQMQTATALADGIFNQWLLGQPEGEAKDATEAKYLKIKTAVLNGLQLALDGVDIAEQAKKDPDITKLLEAADAAWQDLQKFLSDLLSQTVPDNVTALKAKVGAASSNDLKTQLEKLPKHLGKK